MEEEIYLLENLNCAHCASVIEEKIKNLSEVSGAVFSFNTKKLRVIPAKKTDMQALIQRTCDLVEEGVVVKKFEPERKYKKETVYSQLLSKKADLALLALGVAGLAAGTWLERVYPAAGIVCLGVFYVLMGREVLGSALKNILKGQIFDENFLMSIATIGAFVIGEYEEALGVMLFFRVGELFEEIAVERSRSQIMSAVDMRPEDVRVYDDEGKVVTLPAGEAKVGMTVVVRPGERLPLDGVVRKGASRLDTSFVTGEPVPVPVCEGSEVMSGCVNKEGVLEVEVTKPLSESMVSRILEAVEQAAEKKPKMDRFITRFSRVYTPIVVAAALLTAVVPSLVTGRWDYWVYTALTFLVISCPCALVLSIPLAFFSGIGAGSKNGILFKGGLSLEALAAVRAVVLDKTGTITKGTFTVESALPADNVSLVELLSACGLCESRSTHPIAQSMMEYIAGREEMKESAFLENVSLSSYEEVAGKGVRAVCDGHTYLCGSKRLLTDEGVQIPDESEESYSTRVYVSKDGRYLGTVCIADSIKEDAKQAIADLKKKGLTPYMLTGDGESSAKEVAKRVGIENIEAKLLPQDKLDRLISIRKKERSVMFVGDGINDAPVLAAADVGAAMGSGSDAAIEAADVVFMNSTVRSVVKAVSISEKTKKIAVQNVVMAIAIKMAVMIIGLLGLANMWMAVFADTGVAILCILNSARILYGEKSGSTDYRR